MRRAYRRFLRFCTENGVSLRRSDTSRLIADSAASALPDCEGEIDAIRQCPFITGICYTQITDVEQEKNGIYYYDRTPKFDAARLKAIFEKIPSIIENPQDLSGWKEPSD